MSKLIKAEFIKNYSIKKIIVSLLILFVGSLLLILFEKTFGNRVTYDNSFSAISYISFSKGLLYHVDLQKIQFVHEYLNYTY